VKARVFLFQGGEEVAGIVGKGQRGDGDGRGEAGEKAGPAAHETPGRSEGAGQVDILAAGGREVDAQFGVAEGAGQSEHGAGEPDQQDQFRIAQVAGQEAGGGENPLADHVGNDDRGGAIKTELPQQGRIR
jgi:hypothetical protein